MRLLNNLICALGCLTVILAIGMLLWLPSQPWATLSIQLSADAQPITLNATGYEALLMANGLAALPQKAALVIGALSAQPGGGSLLNQLELSERLQLQVRDLAVQTQTLGGAVLPVQAALFILPALTIFMALIVLVSRGYFGQQLLKGVLLILLTLLTAGLFVGLTQVANERLNAVIAASQAQIAAGFPGLGLTVNDALPELRVNLQNRIDASTPLIAGGVALIGSVVALLGACLSARKPALSPAHLARAAAMQAQVAVPSGPAQPTQRLAGQSAEPMCPTCGQPVTAGEKYCRSCGARLS
jgi:hypothetical protein